MTVPENAIPAGSMPPQKEEGQANNQGGKETEGSDNLILGKFKSPEELASAYAALEQDHGRIGNELGQTRKEKETLLDLVTKTVSQGGIQPAGPRNEPPEDYQKLLDETTSAVEQGEMSVGEGLKKVAEITAKMSAQQTIAEVQKAKSQTDAESFITQFKGAHPDFQQALETGALDALKRSNPMHDNFSAYFEWKANQTQAEAEQKVKEAYDKGKSDLSSLAAGAQATTRVLGKAGSEARVTNAPAGPLTEADKISGMMGVLRNARGGGA